MKIEGAAIALVLLAASVFIRPGQADETPDKQHHSIKCITCHTPVATLDSDEIPSFDLTRKCRTCHEPSRIDEQTELTFHRSVKSCSDCHSFHSPDQISAGEISFRFRYDRQSNQQVSCYACHGKGESFTRLSEGHKRAAMLFHINYQADADQSPSEICLKCHSDRTSIDPAQMDGLRIPTFASHEDHPVGVQVVAGAGFPGNQIREKIDPRLRLYNGKLECTTCHSLSGTGKSKLLQFNNVTELCNGCHQVD